VRPEDRHRIHRRRHGQVAVAVERGFNRQWSEFGTSFHWHQLDAGIDHIRLKPRTPRLNGKVRDHRIDSEKFYRLLEGQVIDDTTYSPAACKSGRTTTTATSPRRPNTPRAPAPANPSPAVMGLRQPQNPRRSKSSDRLLILPANSYVFCLVRSPLTSVSPCQHSARPDRPFKPSQSWLKRLRIP
jgi:hypothetical protein